jgi:hypothetical protein
VGRRLLVALSVLQALHAYPVAGSQVAWATFLFVPIGAILVADGWRRSVGALAPAAGPRPAWARPAGAVLALVAVALVAATVRTTGQRLEAAYAAGVPLGLPGTGGIRVRPGQARLYRVLATTLAARCRTFVTMPGLKCRRSAVRPEHDALGRAADRRPAGRGRRPAGPGRRARLCRPQAGRLLRRTGHAADPLHPARVRDGVHGR